MQVAVHIQKVRFHWVTTTMANTRAKRAAESTEPAATASEPTEARSAKRSKNKATQEPRGTQIADAQTEQDAPATEALGKAEDMTTASVDVLIEVDGEGEDPYAAEAPEEMRASDLYLDTVRITLSLLSFMMLTYLKPADKSSSP